MSESRIFLRYSALNNGETFVKGRSKSLKMAPFDRPCMTFYWSAIVITAVFRTIFKLLTLNNTVTLKPGLEVTQGPCRNIGITFDMEKLECCFATRR